MEQPCLVLSRNSCLCPFPQDTVLCLTHHLPHPHFASPTPGNFQMHTEVGMSALAHEEICFPKYSDMCPELVTGCWVCVILGASKQAV